jgi:hypothetical protein
MEGVPSKLWLLRHEAGYHGRILKDVPADGRPGEIELARVDLWPIPIATQPSMGSGLDMPYDAGCSEPVEQPDIVRVYAYRPAGPISTTFTCREYENVKEGADSPGFEAVLAEDAFLF